MIRLARHYRKQLAHKGKHESVKSHSSGFWLHVSRFSYSYVASLDQSTTSTKFSIFRSDGKLIDKEVLEHRQICPAEGLL